MALIYRLELNKIFNSSNYNNNEHNDKDNNAGANNNWNPDNFLHNNINNCRNQKSLILGSIRIFGRRKFSECKWRFWFVRQLEGGAGTGAGQEE